MARYTDVDKLIEQLTASPVLKDMGTEGRIVICALLNTIEEQPAADVVPRAIFSELEAEITAAFNNNSRVIAEHHKKYGDKANFEFLSACYAKNNTLLGIMDFIEELKKKYTEGE